MRTIKLATTWDINPPPAVLFLSCSSASLLLFISQPPAGPSPNQPTGSVGLHAKTIPMASSHCYLPLERIFFAHPDQLQRARRGQKVIAVSSHPQKSNQNALDGSRMGGAKNGCFASSYFTCTHKRPGRKPGSCRLFLGCAVAESAEVDVAMSSSAPCTLCLYIEAGMCAQDHSPPVVCRAPPPTRRVG